VWVCKITTSLQVFRLKFYIYYLFLISAMCGTCLFRLILLDFFTLTIFDHPGWGLGEGLTTHHKRQFVTKCYKGPWKWAVLNTVMNLRFHKKRRFPFLAEFLLTSQGGLCSIELVNNIWWKVQIIKLFIIYFSSVSRVKFRRVARCSHK
jgi:hypothetical protein